MKAIRISLFSCIFISLNLFAQSQPQQTAENWLKLLDEGNHSATWQQMAPTFKNQLTEQDWRSSLKGLRTTFGNKKQRTLTDSQIAQSSSEYSNMTFKTHYQNATMKEVVTLEKIGGSWLVAGFALSPE